MIKLRGSIELYKKLREIEKNTCKALKTFKYLQKFGKTMLNKVYFVKSTLFDKWQRLNFVFPNYCFLKVLRAFRVSRGHFQCFRENKIKQSKTFFQSFVQLTDIKDCVFLNASLSKFKKCAYKSSGACYLESIKSSATTLDEILIENLLYYGKTCLDANDVQKRDWNRPLLCRATGGNMLLNKKTQRSPAFHQFWR